MRSAERKGPPGQRLRHPGHSSAPQKRCIAPHRTCNPAVTDASVPMHRPQVDAIVYLVDAADRERFPESKRELDALLSDDNLAKVCVP